MQGEHFALPTANVTIKNIVEDHEEIRHLWKKLFCVNRLARWVKLGKIFKTFSQASDCLAILVKLPIEDCVQIFFIIEMNGRSEAIFLCKS